MGKNNSFNTLNLECKYCLDIIDIENNEFIRPCLCKDYVHKECFENWIPCWAIETPSAEGQRLACI